MNVLLPLTESQEIRIIPRDYDSLSGVTVILIEDGSGKKQTIENVSGAVEGNYVKYDVTFSILILNSTYTIEFQDNQGSVIYKGKVFCKLNLEKTSRYSINSGKYTQHTSNTLNQKYIIVDGGSTDEAPIPGGGEVVKCYDEAEMEALTSAVKICDLYCVTIDEVDYDDWYLPSRNEAIVLYDFMGILNDALSDFGYDPFYLPTVESTPSGPQQTNRYYWTSTERSSYPAAAVTYQRFFYLQPLSSITKDVAEDCYLSEDNCNAQYEFFHKTRVRPVRFEAGVDGETEKWEKGYGGVVAGAYTLDGVEGALIVSPTEPKSANAYTQWSDLGQTTTGITGEDDGRSNTQAILALGG